MKKFTPLFHFLKTVFKMSRSVLLFSVCSAVMKAAAPIVTLLLSAQLLRGLTTHAEALSILACIAKIVLFNLCVGVIQSCFTNRLKTLSERLKDDFSLHVGQKMMQMNYGKLESAYIQDLKQQALLPIVEWGTFEFILEEFVPSVLSGIITIVTTLFLVIEYRPLLILPVLLTVLIHLVLINLKNKRFQSVMMRVGLIERKLGYYNTVTSDFSLGKDIRIFRMDQILMHKIKELNDKEVGEFSKLFYRAASLDFWETIVVQIQIYLVYLIAAVDLLKKAIRIDYFFQITGLFINFGNAIFQLMNAFVNLKARNRFLEKFMEFDLLPTESKAGGECHDAPSEIEVSHLSFGYDQSSQILSDISFVVPKGRTVALVGENGSGKTTIAKLISGLLTPTSGQILIDGKQVTEAMGGELSAVYQDFQLFPFSIRENIETSYQGRGDVLDTLEAVGMLSAVQGLNAGVDTLLFKAFDENGIEFSYGQSQKLATARALYKNAGIILLDEPTSALDAQAEYEVFKDFHRLTAGKTSFLISHRLWSCRFCDEILVLADHGIVERGTHEQLMSIENGKYRTMFLAQAQYYAEK